LTRIHRTIISVYDKTGIVELAAELVQFGIEIVSTGGTFQVLKEGGIPVKSVEEVTGFPEILQGRVKTLHPNILAGILARRDLPRDTKQIRELHIKPFELVIVNLYPFEETIANESHTLSEAIEQIDIGGPSLIRAAAKNFKNTTVVISPKQYPLLLDELKNNDGCISENTRFQFATEAFQHTAHYDAVITSYFSSQTKKTELQETITFSLKKTMPLRYGENPHQAGAVYGQFDSFFQKIHGKELSFNNILDIQSAACLCSEFDQPTAVIVKHNNPCGVASSHSICDAYKLALATDPKSAFGGIICFNQQLDEQTAKTVNEIFSEVIIAPEFSIEALTILKTKKDRRIVVQSKPLPREDGLDIRSIPGGLLVQEPDYHRILLDEFRVVTKRKPTKEEINAMLFSWRVVKHIRSNAIVFTGTNRTLGIGAGQMSRVDSARIAALKAQENNISLQGSTVASDAFFPFADGLLETIKVGATSIIQPGGSIRDQEIISAADEHNVAMVFTGVRHFRH
jgi:phosphoribosylaminoimidazolecarboxamide formyltransferase/IMP cyclohydrolase